ncbi:MAG: VWA domain-containing protein [Thiotrichales bacterium]|nr:VWA domain-containing protein [Thiotrichales bacterium]
MSIDISLLEQAQRQLNCAFPSVVSIFPDCWHQAQQQLSNETLEVYLQAAARLCKMGRGAEPVQLFLQEMPAIAAHLGPAAMKLCADFAFRLARSPNAQNLAAFLQTLHTVAQRLDTAEALEQYLQLLEQHITQSSPRIHAHSTIYPSTSLTQLLSSMPLLMQKLSLQGLKNWIAIGLRDYAEQPEAQQAYFALRSAEARSALLRQRSGVLFKDIERKMQLFQQALWQTDLPCLTYSTLQDHLRKPLPYLDSKGLRLPDLLAPHPHLSAENCYRATLAHLLAHQRWSRPLLADNYAPQMQLFIQTFEDARVDRLAMARYPGLCSWFLALHPLPALGACNTERESCLRYRATRLSMALLNADFDPQDPLIEAARTAFNQLLADKGEATQTAEMVELGAAYFVKSRCPSDSQMRVFFADTEIPYRDDNRCLWIHHEERDEAEDSHLNEYESDEKWVESADSLPPRSYPEWDAAHQDYRLDWATVYERLQPAGDPHKIDQRLVKHQRLAKQLKRQLDLLKPQHKQRLRFQEDGTELDLDIALRSLIDFRSGLTPDPRINTHQQTNGRSLSVTLLLDLSESLNQKIDATGQTLLDLSEESVALLAWAIDQLGDPFAICAFHSNTRHEVRFHHIKGFNEAWDSPVKARLGALQAQYSTRMGAALRHAGRYLAPRPTEKKLLLVLTDGEPADIDVHEPMALTEDARKAVQELAEQGIFCYGITLDRQADAYVERIFGHHYSIIDRIERLPQQLTQLFIKLTH